MDLLTGLRAFVATAQTGSFTAAAERLGVSNRLTSKYVAELEARLGVRLLQRTTRRVGLTPAGDQMLARAPALLDDLDDLLGAVSEEGRGFSGTLRIAAPVTLGETYLAGLLHRFAAAHPGLSIDLRLTDAYVDLASDGIDLAFRVGAAPATALVAHRLGRIRSRVVASPAYLARQGVPERLEDLDRHTLLLDSNRRGGPRWQFQRDGEPVDWPVTSAFHVNSARVARDLAAAGAGLTQVPDFVLDEAIATGQLVPVLTEFEGPGHVLSVVWLEGARLPRKLRALIDFAEADLRQRL